MVLPFAANTNNTNNGELPRILTEEEQILLAVDQGVHEVNRLRYSKVKFCSIVFFVLIFESYKYFYLVT
jgi:hypothetical protein